MPLPAGVETVTVSSGEPLTLPDGTLIQGRLIFTGPGLVTIADDDVILGGRVETQLVDGEFSVTLVATDATGMSPTGWTYQVTAALSNAPGWERYISLPKAVPDVVLADILIPDPVEGTYATLADASTFAALAGATFTGAVTVDGADITVVDGQLVLDSSGTAINAVDRGATSNFAAYLLRTAGVDRWSLQMVNNGTNDLLLSDSAQGTVALLVESRATAPNLSLLTAAKQYGSGAGVVFLPDCTTPPSTNPSGGGVLFAEGGALKWRGSAGTVTTIAPA